MNHLIGVTRTGQECPQGIPTGRGITGFLLQLPLHRAERGLTWIQGAGRELQQPGRHRKAVLAQNHNAAIGEHRNRQGCARVLHHSEGALDTHRQLHPVDLKAQLAHVQAGRGLELARRLWSGQWRHGALEAGHETSLRRTELAAGPWSERTLRANQ